MDKLKRYTDVLNFGGDKYCKSEDVAALEKRCADAENNSQHKITMQIVRQRNEAVGECITLRKRCAELEDETEGYGDLVDKLSNFVSDYTDGDGWYGNDPAELIWNIRREINRLLVEGAEAEDRAARAEEMARVLAEELKEA